MQVIARLNNLRMSPRKVRAVTNLVKGLNVKAAKAQLRFLPKRASSSVFKLLNSAISNAKNNFSLNEENLYIEKLVVDAGTSLKRWLPRAMGRATPLLKRVSNISLILNEKVPTEISETKKKKKVAQSKEKNAKKPVEKEETIFAATETEETTDKKSKGKISPRPYEASSESKRKSFSRQTIGNIRKVFRRKSV